MTCPQRTKPLSALALLLCLLPLTLHPPPTPPPILTPPPQLTEMEPEWWACWPSKGLAQTSEWDNRGPRLDRAPVCSEARGWGSVEMHLSVTVCVMSYHGAQLMAYSTASHCG